jgi:hypothetical protein
MASAVRLRHRTRKAFRRLKPCATWDLTSQGRGLTKIMRIRLRCLHRVTKRNLRPARHGFDEFLDICFCVLSMADNRTRDHYCINFSLIRPMVNILGPFSDPSNGLDRSWLRTIYPYSLEKPRNSEALEPRGPLPKENVRSFLRFPLRFASIGGLGYPDGSAQSEQGA